MFAIDTLQPSCLFLNPTHSMMQQSNSENTIYASTDNGNTNSSSITTTDIDNGFLFQCPSDYYANTEYLATPSSFNLSTNWSFSQSPSTSMTPISPINANNYISFSNSPSIGAPATTTSECSSPLSAYSPISTFDSSISLIPGPIPSQLQTPVPSQSNPSSPNVYIASTSAAAAAATALAISAISPSEIVSAKSIGSTIREKRKSPSLKSPGNSTKHYIAKSTLKTKRVKSDPIVSACLEPLEKKHQCQICGKYFRRDLPRHLRTHLEITRFECPFPREICPHKQGQFNRPYDFKKHLLHGHFIFDDQKKVRGFRDLHQKLSYTGTCRCGLRFTAGEWLDNHVLAGDSRCPFLVKIPKDNLAATRVLVSEQLQNASTSLAPSPGKTEYVAQDVTYQQAQSPNQLSTQIQVPMSHSVEHPVQYQALPGPQISPIPQQLSLSEPPQQIPTMVIQQISPVGLVHSSHPSSIPNHQIQSSIPAQMLTASSPIPTNIYDQLQPATHLHAHTPSHFHQQLHSQVIVSPNLSIMGPDNQAPDQSSVQHHLQF